MTKLLNKGYFSVKKQIVFKSLEISSCAYKATLKEERKE